jgi:transcriptional regulator with XRE-family HTH domain
MDFASLLKRLLDERDLGVREFARKIRISAGFISDVLHGKQRPSEKLELWADALELTGEERSRFLLAGALARSPKIVRDHVANLEEKVAAPPSTAQPKPPVQAKRKT